MNNDFRRRRAYERHETLLVTDHQMNAGRLARGYESRYL